MRHRIAGHPLLISMLALGLGGAGGAARADDAFAVLHDFSIDGAPAYNQDGKGPSHGVLLGADGNLYGTAPSGGPNDAGTVFRLSPATRQFTLLHGFNAQDGAAPGSLVRASNGNLYGVTSAGGANDGGIAYLITPDGAYTILHQFARAERPSALVIGSDGNLYGATESGGAGYTGSIFRIGASGVYTLLYSFTTADANGNNADGISPDTLLQGVDGNLYGLAAYGGTSDAGTVFRFSPATQQLTNLHSFDGTNGFDPVALVQTGDGTLLGATVTDWGAGGGTLFHVTPSGAFGVDYLFPNNGTSPRAPTGLALDKNGVLYGVTEGGGQYQQGTVFQATALEATGTPLFSFAASVPSGGNAGGTDPDGPPAIDGNGVLYGTATQGGQFANGTVFSYRTPSP